MRRALALALVAAACASPLRPRGLDPLADWFRRDPWRQGRGEGAHAPLDAPPIVWLDEAASRGATRVGTGGLVRCRGTDAVFTTRAIRPPLPFTELLPSWNLDCAPDTEVIVEVQVAEREAGDWSEWARIGDWPGPIRAAAAEPAEEASWRVDVDVLRSAVPLARARLRVRVATLEEAPDARASAPSFDVHRLSAVFSDLTRFEAPGETSETIDASRPLPPLRHGRALPARSQRDAPPELAPRICSPTSVAMVLESFGRTLDTQAVAARLYDAEHDLYGNWNRAIQGAFALGVRGRLVRVEDWRSVEAALARGERLVVRVRVENGELHGAPYRQTAGHLLCLVGLDAGGGVRVNDPAAHETITRTYSKDDLESVWMRPSGVAYAFDAAAPAGGQ